MNAAVWPEQADIVAKLRALSQQTKTRICIRFGNGNEYIFEDGERVLSNVDFPRDSDGRRTIELSKDQRLRVGNRAGAVLECHLEQINKNGNWNGRAWFYLTRVAVLEMLQELDPK